MAWTIKDIKKRIFDLETRKKSIKNPNKVFQIDQTIASLYEIIDYMSSEVVDSKYSVKRIVKDDRKYINAHLPYASMVDSFATSYQDKETIISFKPDYVQIADMSKDKVCSVTKDVYDTVKDERFTTPFLELFNKRFHYLNYAKKPKVTSHGNEAVTLPVYNTRDVYIHMYKSGNIHDYLASIHEYGHAITALINQDFRFEYGKSLFIETDGIFFEMIGNDYLGDNEVIIISEELLKEKGLIPSRRAIKYINIPETTEEVKPILYFDEETNEVKGKCKLKPFKNYFAFEVRQGEDDDFILLGGSPVIEE